MLKLTLLLLAPLTLCAQGSGVTVRPDRLVIDQSVPLNVDVTGVGAAAAPSLHLVLKSAGKESTVVRDLGTFKLSPAPKVQVKLAGIPDGTYRLAAELRDGDTQLLNTQQSVALAEGIVKREAETQKRLDKIKGHESAKATVRWPYDMASVVNNGVRKLETTDFGLPEEGLQTFDFAKEMKDSEEVLKALEAGKDPLVRAKGDHERHYALEEAGEIMPYRVYVPSTWDGKKQLPLMFVLHGNTRDHNFYFDRDGGILAKLAEQHGYIVATTMGYRPNAGYNAQAINTLNGAAPPANGGGRGFLANPAMRRQGELSETDAMDTLDLVIREYNPDPKRIYLFGHSAGGTGGWYIASKYPEKFAGIALSAFGTQPNSVPWDKLKGIPILVIVGSKDAPRTVETARNMAKAVKEKGFDTQFLEVPEATHDTIVGQALPTVYNFFDAHKNKSTP